ncbi:MAG TPA: hypothetical protein VIO11_03810, partial [Candidatus Methanoperedens sp.]
MKTLLEFITYVKGVEYLIVIAFCFGFIALWSVLNSREKSMSKVASMVIPLSLIFGGGAIVMTTYGTTDAVPAQNVSESTLPEMHNSGDIVDLSANDKDKAFRVNDSEYLSIKYGPATAFHDIMSTKVSCTTCHHNSKDEIHACRDCHTAPIDPHNSS